MRNRNNVLHDHLRIHHKAIMKEAASVTYIVAVCFIVETTLSTRKCFLTKLKGERKNK